MNVSYYNKTSDFNLQKGGYWIEKIAFFEKNLKKLKNKENKSLEILDLACNDGNLSLKYSRFGKVTAIDLNENAIQIARNKKINAICADVFEIDRLFKEKKFNVVIAGDIIEHVFDTDLLIKKIHAVLIENGILLLSTPNLVSIGRRLMAVLGINPYCEFSTEKNGKNVGHIRYYTHKNIKQQLEKNGFISIEIESDTINLPAFKFLDKILVKLFPKLGRELLIKAIKK